MTARPVLIDPPTLLPVDIEACKAHAVIDFDGDDAILETYIAAATGHLDGPSGILGRAIMEQTWEIELPSMRLDFVLPVPSARQVQIFAEDAYGGRRRIDVPDASVRYHARGMAISLRGDQIPMLHLSLAAPPRVRIVTGYADPVEVPKPIQAAIMMMVREMYDDRAGGEVRKPGSTIDRLVQPYRWLSL